MATQQQIPVANLPAYLEAMLARIRTLSFAQPLQKQCAESVRSFTKQNFARGRGPGGETWAPLKMPRPRGSGGQKPLRDTGLLMASVTTRGAKGTIERVTDLTLTLGTNLDRALIHQHGGILRPKSGRALAIPLTRQAVTAGSPRRMSGLVLVWPQGRRAGWLQTSAQGRRQPVRHWLLKTSVTIPPRPFLGWNDEMANEQAAIIGEHVERELART